MDRESLDIIRPIIVLLVTGGIGVLWELNKPGLLRSCRKAQVNKVEHFLAKHPDHPLNEPREGDNSPLIEVLSKGTDSDPLTPSECDERRRREEIVRILLDHGANPDKPRGSDGCPLDIAAERSLEGAVAALLKAGANPNGAYGEGWPMLWAASRKNLPIARMLLDAGADVNRRPDELPSALMGACEVGSVEMALLLLDHGADINAQDGDDDTALHMASLSGHVDVVNLLMARGADTELCNDHGLSAAMAVRRMAGDDETSF